MKKLWDLKKVLSYLELEGHGHWAGHHHGSHTPTSIGAILLSKMACQPKHFGRQCGWQNHLGWGHLPPSSPVPTALISSPAFLSQTVCLDMTFRTMRCWGLGTEIDALSQQDPVNFLEYEWLCNFFLHIVIFDRNLCTLQNEKNKVSTLIEIIWSHWESK